MACACTRSDCRVGTLPPLHTATATDPHQSVRHTRVSFSGHTAVLTASGALPAMATTVRVSAVIDLLTGHEVFDIDKILRTTCDVHQSDHRGDLSGLFLEAP